ncbi:MAG: NTP transferase domain-containing protein [Verrucomicrobia bacterium]|nr:NTP transferase domain-containing protein [Verrucomicrobiota bacterium]
MATLSATVRLAAEKVFTLPSAGASAPRAPEITWPAGAPLLVVLAAGRGTRFGAEPKCIQPVGGTPLARHSIDNFRATFSPAPPVVAIVGYRHETVSRALGPDNVYVLSDDPAAGTAFAVFEAFSLAAILPANPLAVVTMGDRIVPTETFRRLLDKHTKDNEADLTLLTARHQPPRHLGKGRVLRNEAGRVTRIVEEKDIAAESDAVTRQALHNLTETNCPLYAIRARTLHRLLSPLNNANAQGQFYLTDIVEALAAEGGEIRTITTEPADSDYDLLCADVTRPGDLAVLEGVLRRQQGLDAVTPTPDEVEGAAQAIAAGRPKNQIASIARQLAEIVESDAREKLGCAGADPVAIGISGGRLRIAFMHPDMGRFFGPAWQMPIGAGSEASGEQIVVVAQATDDRRLHLYPLNPKYRENINHLAADDEIMFPGAEIADWHSYEHFGTRMSETLLLSLGYFSDDEIEARRKKGLPLPPPSLRVASNMRRPFALVANALASFRTLRDGHLGARVQQQLGRHRFGGLRLLCTGDIPQGGFSSSSALTVATKNALNHLFRLEVPGDVLVHLACQAEYGTGVRAGSLDQATEQKGRVGQGTLISSNPADNYRILATYPVPADRFRVIFPYSVERDRTAWRWSGGLYAETTSDERLTAGEWRKLTGKSAEIAAILTRLPVDQDFFKKIEADLLDDGRLDTANRAWAAAVLARLPRRIARDELRARVVAERDWYAGELQRVHNLDRTAALGKADTTIEALFAGWREPRFRHTEPGVPLRAMVAYLFSEVAKNFHLIRHPGEWIACVTRSQRGDRSLAIDPQRLPERAVLEQEQPWETGLAGPERLAAWLERCGAKPYDFDAELDDATLAGAVPPEFHLWAGGSFFRGLALIDLAEAMLKRAFGEDAVAVRVNAAGQGDYFQAHLDTTRVDPEAVKQFLRVAFYRRFALTPDPEFVETSPGGGAVGVSLSRFSSLPAVIACLRAMAAA